MSAAAVTGWRVWLLAIRPRTLPAAVSPVLVGTAVAFREHGLHLPSAVVAVLVALLLQITANLANDLFDYKRGADVERVGPRRVTQAGLVSPQRMMWATAIVLAASTILGLYLVVRGGWPILLLGLLAMIAAVAYTGGPFPLGYHGLGDPFVFLFFGLAGVAGTAYLQTGEVTRLSLLAATAIGCLAVNIIVVNNLRDMATDARAGKRTLAVRVGRGGTITEFVAMLSIAYLVPLLLRLLGEIGLGWWLPWLTFPVAFRLVRQLGTLQGSALNAVLGGSAKLTLSFGVAFAVGIALWR